MLKKPCFLKCRVKQFLIFLSFTNTFTAIPYALRCKAQQMYKEMALLLRSIILFLSTVCSRYIVLICLFVEHSQLNQITLLGYVP